MERTCPEEHLNLSKSGFVSEEDHSGCKSQNIAFRELNGSVLCQIWSILVNWCGSSKRTSSHLATIVSRALQPQDGRILRPVDRNLQFLKLPTLMFCSFLDNVEIIVHEICLCKKSRGHQTSKIVKSNQSYSNGHLPYHCSF